MAEIEICSTCGGDGKVSPENAECPTCMGSGEVPLLVKCPTCQGAHYVGNDPCLTCFVQGTTPLHGILPEMLKKIVDLGNRTNDVLDKCDDILEAIAEM